MECPFELPVKRVDYNDSYTRAPLKNKGIVTADNITLIKLIWPSYADYIVTAINSHEKLIKIKQISYEAICTGDQEASDKAIGLIEDFEQALKEAGKE